MAAGLQAAAPQTADTGRPPENELLFDQNTQASEPALQTQDALPGVGIGDFLRVILVLGIVIGLIYAFVWMLKKLTGVKAGGSDSIRLFSTRPLKGDAALHLIGAGQRIFLIGSCGSQVSLIAEIDDQEAMDEIRLSASAQTTAPGGLKSFKERLGATVRRPADAQSEASPDFIRAQRERLKDL